MNKFRRFLGRISAKTCLKMNYFGSKSQKFAKRWSLFPQASLPLRFPGAWPQTPIEIKWSDSVQNLTTIGINDWCRCLAILGKNETYILYFLPTPLFKKRSRTTRVFI